MATNMDTSKSAIALKFPYPVLNDKRDLKEILNILNDKEKELKKKMQQARLTYKQTDKNDVKRKEKLKQLYKNFKTQLNKIEEQLDFVKTSIKIKKINKLQVKKESKNYKKEQLEELETHLNELTTFMKEENKKFLRENKLKQQPQPSKGDLNNVDNENQHNQISDDIPLIGPIPAPPNYYQQIPPPSITQQQHQNQTQTPFGTSWHQTPIYSHLQHPSTTQTALMNPFHSLQNAASQAQVAPHQYYQQTIISQIPTSQSTNHDVIQTHLAGVTQKQTADILTASDIENANSIIINNLAMGIAQTAAMAHAAAAITAAAYNPPAPPSTDTKDNTIQIPILPTKNEISKAASTFANYRNKIKAFLDIDRNIIKYTKNSLKTINFAYDNDDMNEDITINNKNDEYHNKNNTFYNIDDVSSEEDDNSDTELCIELTSNKNSLNYILPSSNSYGIQVAVNRNDVNSELDNMYNNQFINNSKSALFTAQRSMFTVTFMGSSAILNKNISLSNILYKKK